MNMDNLEDAVNQFRQLQATIDVIFMEHYDYYKPDKKAQYYRTGGLLDSDYAGKARLRDCCMFSELPAGRQN